VGPIVEAPDGLRLEGGMLCAGDCGSGSVYRLAAVEDSYEVIGKDDTFGSWIA
jgi:hypothetical protein